MTIGSIAASGHAPCPPHWIDRANVYGGFWATHTLPMGDVTAFGSYLEFETALYASLAG